MTLAEFEIAWRQFVLRWSRSGDTEAHELVEGVLADGLSSRVSAQGSADPSTEELLACERAVLAASGWFDESGYRAAHHDVVKLVKGTIDPLDHFCTEGWLSLRNPCRDFDVDWYWHAYLDPLSDSINPLLHHVVMGRQVGHLPRRISTATRPSAPRGEGARRVCLVAGHDVDGRVDPYVIDYVTELSRHADVYYLADGHMDTTELDKLAHATRGAWAVDHGGHDAGSYALLARDLVGWSAIEEYDELLLVNDSCYLLRPLGPVFDRMEQISADWWGLEPTKRAFARAHGDVEPISLAEAKRHRTPAEDWNLRDRLHVGAHFVLLRHRVLNDPGFRARLAAVRREPDQTLAALRHAIGISNDLLGSGYDLATFSDVLRPYDSLYTADFFAGLEHGLPILKRSLLAENPFDVPDLAQWKGRVLEHAPEARVDLFEDNLRRVAADDRLQRSFAIVTQADGTVVNAKPLHASAFIRSDGSAPKFEHWWAFPVCFYDHTFAGNERAVFEEVKDDPSIKKVILTRSRSVEVSGTNVVVVPLKSPQGQHHLVRSGQIFVKHGPTTNLRYRVDTTTHNVINLWHGIPLKRFGKPSARFNEKSVGWVTLNAGGSRAVVTSSKMDSLAMSAAFFPASYPDMWPTGLPRNDFVLRADEELPPDLRDDVRRLRDEVDGRRLVMFLPTFRDGLGESQYVFDPSELARLADWANRHDAVIGIREHMADKARTYSGALLPLGAINLSARRYPTLEVLYRVADALISDYSSCLVDFLLTGKPVMSFAYDYEHYSSAERGLFYELDRVLPGPVCRTFDELAAALDGVFDQRSAAQMEEYDWKRRIFFDHLDDQASWRVVQRVKSLYIADD